MVLYESYYILEFEYHTAGYYKKKIRTDGDAVKAPARQLCWEKPYYQKQVIPTILKTGQPFTFGHVTVCLEDGLGCNFTQPQQT